MKCSSLEALYSTLNVPVTPVQSQEGVTRELPNGGTESMEGRYNLSVRDNTTVRQSIESGKPKQPQEYTEADWYMLAHQRREQQREAEHQRKWIVTIDPITGIKTETRR
jgi:hypothetical protein